VKLIAFPRVHLAQVVRVERDHARFSGTPYHPTSSVAPVA